MIAEPRTWVDVEGAIRAWARDAVVTSGGRVFFAANSKVTDPQIVLQRIAGTDDNCLIQCDVWAGSKAAAAALAAELASEADALASYHFDGVVLHGAAVESIRWRPDEESNAPRYIVDITFTATASTSSS